MPKGPRNFNFALEKSAGSRLGIPHSFSGIAAHLQNGRRSQPSGLAGKISRQRLSDKVHQASAQVRPLN